MKKQKGEFKTVSSVIPYEQHKMLRIIALEKDTHLSNIVASALDSYLEQQIQKGGSITMAFEIFRKPAIQGRGAGRQSSEPIAPTMSVSKSKRHLRFNGVATELFLEGCPGAKKVALLMDTENSFIGFWLAKPGTDAVSLRDCYALTTSKNKDGSISGSSICCKTFLDRYNLVEKLTKTNKKRFLVVRDMETGYNDFYKVKVK